MTASRAHSEALHRVAVSLTTAAMVLLPGATEEEFRDIDPDARISQAIDDLNQIKRERRKAQLGIGRETVSHPAGSEADGSRGGSRVSGAASAPVRRDLETGEA